jgi:HSP20 family protein
MLLQRYEIANGNGHGLETEVDRVVGQIFGGWLRPDARGFAPAVDVLETPDAIELRADLPGVKASDLQLSIEKDVLTLRGERKDERADSGASYHLYERRFSGFERTFTLPSHVDSDKVEAKVTDGVLTIRLAKRPEARPRTIAIKTE